MKRFFDSLLKVIAFHPIRFAIILIVVLSLITGTCGIIHYSTIQEVEEDQNNFVMIGEKTLVHKQYMCDVKSASTVDTCEVIGKNGETILKEGNYIAVEISIDNQDETRTRKLSTFNFLIKDHSGIHFPISQLIDFPDVHISEEHGDVYSTVNFNTRRAEKDYRWEGKDINDLKGQIIKLYFEFKEGYCVENIVMILEIDFEWGENGTNRGVDIVLAKRKEVE